jgi:hypothetical protein
VGEHDLEEGVAAHGSLGAQRTGDLFEGCGLVLEPVEHRSPGVPQDVGDRVTGVEPVADRQCVHEVADQVFQPVLGASADR